MKFAILGTRGIPASYGGFETFAEELSTRLAARGHQVTVYCRRRAGEPTYRGVRLVHLPTVRHKYFDTVVHTFLSTLHLLGHRQDAALYCNAANAVFTWMPRSVGIPVALNVDGLERKRRKWGPLGRAWYQVSERLAAWFPNEVVSDARVIQRYYLERYRKATRFIPYGAAAGKLPTTQALDQLGLAAGGYFLYVSRMEPENNALLVREAFERVETEVKLVLVGDAPYAQEYLKRVRDTRDHRVVIPGAIYGRAYHELLSHCLAYVHATEVGGTHPALVEALGRGCLTLFLNTPENAEVAGGVAIPFEKQNLSERLRFVLQMSEEERGLYRERAMEHVRANYNWEQVTDAYEQLLVSLARSR
jgi:glycosyltransferase involved in cell wall biosynthesis